MSKAIALTSGKKATLKLYDSQPSGSGAKPGDYRDSVDFQFNPKEVTIQKGATWERKPAQSAATAAPAAFTGPHRGDVLRCHRNH